MGPNSTKYVQVLIDVYVEWYHHTIKTKLPKLILPQIILIITLITISHCLYSYTFPKVLRSKYLYP